MHYSVTGFIELDVDGEKIVLKKAVIDELHRQEKIQWGRDILANYQDMITKPFKDVTDSEFEKLATVLETKMMSNNGKTEIEAITEVFEIEII